MLREMLLRPLTPYRDKTGVLIFEFGTFGQRSFRGCRANFSTGWIRSWRACRRSSATRWRSAIPNSWSRTTSRCLRDARVAHVYNAWSRMPELHRQIAIPDSVTTDFQVCRALLRRGRPYEEAVETFPPYTEVQDPNPEARESMRVLIGRARENKEFLFLFVNNRLEGNAPMTILSVTEP